MIWKRDLLKYSEYINKYIKGKLFHCCTLQCERKLLWKFPGFVDVIDCCAQIMENFDMENISKNCLVYCFLFFFFVNDCVGIIVC